MNFVEMLKNLWASTGFAHSEWENYVMMVIACVLLFVGIGLKKEPLLLVPIGFGMLFVNIPGANEILLKEPVEGTPGGLLYYMEKGVEWVIFPPLVFLGIGAMTDFGPLIANPKSFLMGAAAQLGIFLTLLGAIVIGFDGAQAAATAIIGGADGPTSIYVTLSLIHI